MDLFLSIFNLNTILDHLLYYFIMFNQIIINQYYFQSRKLLKFKIILNFLHFYSINYPILYFINIKYFS